jgi:single stranded DNA-binding protein
MGCANPGVIGKRFICKKMNDEYEPKEFISRRGATPTKKPLLPDLPSGRNFLWHSTLIAVSWYWQIAIGDTGMRDWNEVVLIGHCGEDAELKSTTDGKAIIRFSLATSVKWLDKPTGEWKSNTEWHHIIAWDKAAEALAVLAKKGSRLMVRGKIHYNEFTKQDGTIMKETQIRVEDFGKMEKSDHTGGVTTTGPTKSPFIEDDPLPF